MNSERRRNFEHQIVVRVDDQLHADLLADAAANGRTLAQTVRFLLRRSLADRIPPPPPPAGVPSP